MLARPRNFRENAKPLAVSPTSWAGTELLPVMLPMDASAYGSWIAAVREANVSGRDLPGGGSRGLRATTP